jgi:altronate dehydratase
MALASEFDLAESVSIDEVIELINKVANGQKTKSELSGIGEIVAPRYIRSA